MNKIMRCITTEDVYKRQVYNKDRKPVQIKLPQPKKGGHKNTAS